MADQKSPVIKDLDCVDDLEKIINRLYISGRITDGKLLKTDLQNETDRYIAENNITHFTNADMPKAMLKNNYCHNMEEEMADKSTHFSMIVANIQKMNLDHYIDRITSGFKEEEAKQIVEEEEPSCKGGPDHGKHLTANLEYVSTVAKDSVMLKSTDFFQQCVVCQITFENEENFEQHMKDHGVNFSLSGTNQILRMMDVDFTSDKSGDLIVCKITTTFYEFTLKSAVLIVPPDNQIKCQADAVNKSLMEFRISCDLLDNTVHPYTVLIFSEDELGKLFITKYHIVLNHKDPHSEQSVLITLKEKNPKLKIEKMKLPSLPQHYVDETVKSLSRKNFRVDNLNSQEKQELERLNALRESGLTRENYMTFWTLFSEVEECEQQKEMSKLDRYEVEFEYFTQTFCKLYIGDFEDIRNSHQSGDLKEGIRVAIAPVGAPKRKIYARVQEIQETDILLRFERGESLDKISSDYYNVHFLLDRTCFQMEREALRLVNQHNMFYFTFPSKTAEASSINETSYDWVNESFHQNPEQQTAVTHIVEKTSHPAPYILMGPPGTGKTTTIVEAICQIIRKDPSVHILFTASSNFACDEISLRLFKFISKEKVYRMFTFAKHNEVDSIDPELIENSNMKYGVHYYPTLEELKQYNVIICTPVVAGRFAQAKIDCDHFSYVFIDDSVGCTEPTSLIPIAGVISSPDKLHGQVVLCGDPEQLGPIIRAEIAEDVLGVSLLERLIGREIYLRDPETGKYDPEMITKLLQNYRSHPKILEFSNKKFYEGELVAAGKPEITHWACGWNHLPNKEVPMIFSHVVGITDREDFSPSLFNMAEVDEVVAYVQMLLTEGKIGEQVITQKSIAVISPYKKQCEKIEIECSKRDWNDIKVGSVDLFQGQEKPIIIFSTVRSDTNTLGFLDNPKRLNVALTRAQGLLIVIGNKDTLEKNPLWREFVEFCKENNLVKISERKVEQKSKRDKAKQRSRNYNNMYYPHYMYPNPCPYIGHPAAYISCPLPLRYQPTFRDPGFYRPFPSRYNRNGSNSRGVPYIPPFPFY